MAALHPAYKCRCHIATPMFVDADTHMLGNQAGSGMEESGICFACRGIYDEQLYEMRLRQHTPNLPEGDLDIILRKIDPRYAALVGT